MAVRHALPKSRGHGSGGTLSWLRDDLVQAVLEELTRRYWEREQELDQYLAALY